MNITNIPRLLAIVSVASILVMAMPKPSHSTQIIAPVRDTTMTWEVKSNHDNVTKLKFFSRENGRVWPGHNKHWTIDDYEFHSYQLQCTGGEKICYGAWSGNTYWGKGEGENGCENCCYTCRDGRRRTTLNK